MLLKKITIVYLPDGINAVKQFKVPKLFLKLFMVLFLSITAGIVWVSSDYLKLKKNIPEKLSLLNQNNQYKNQLISLAGKIDQINKKVAELKEFENKIKIMVNLDTGEEETQFLGIGGSDFSLLESEDATANSDQKLIGLMHQSLENISTEISVQAQEKTELFDFIESQKSMFACTPSISPTEGWVSSRFGYRVSPFTNKKEFHSGLDISSRMGTEIVAPADGVVASVAKSDGMGINITINHGYGFKTIYGHLSKTIVKTGQAIKRGQIIALMGNTGRSTGPHLHYEVHLNDVAVNPERYILN
ncbi:MAG: peptidoglycan DD-metalloendopeptidase family protein [Deltaproteobacteria bacterium]|nr:peptidoglycan DD-metalloendopeptidase family protein [Deltaproteobacteria bacterium]